MSEIITKTKVDSNLDNIPYDNRTYIHIFTECIFTNAIILLLISLTSQQSTSTLSHETSFDKNRMICILIIQLDYK